MIYHIFNFSSRWGKTVADKLEGLNSGPVVLFDESNNVLIISPFSHFMAASHYFDKDNVSLSWGIMGNVDFIPKGYKMEILAYYSQSGVNMVHVFFFFFFYHSYLLSTQYLLLNTGQVCPKLYEKFPYSCFWIRIIQRTGIYYQLHSIYNHVRGYTGYDIVWYICFYAATPPYLFTPFLLVFVFFCVKIHAEMIEISQVNNWSFYIHSCPCMHMTAFFTFSLIKYRFFLNW